MQRTDTQGTPGGSRDRASKCLQMPLYPAISRYIPLYPAVFRVKSFVALRDQSPCPSPGAFISVHRQARAYPFDTETL